MLRLGCCHRSMPAGSVSQVKAQQPSNLPIEVYFASLDTRREQCALADFENPSGQTQAIRMHQSSNIDAVANFDLFHGFTLWKICYSTILYYALPVASAPRKFRGMIRLRAKRKAERPQL